MKWSEILLGLPLDVSSRLAGLASHIADIKPRVTQSALSELLMDFEGTTMRFIDSCKNATATPPESRWIKLHEAVDKITKEWHLITELLAHIDLGSSYTKQFERYVDLAMKDIGLEYLKDRYLLIPTFGEYFSLTTFKYSPDLAMLKLPVSVIKAPWERSVIWHEIAGVKVKKIGKLLSDHLDKFKEKNNIVGKEQAEDPFETLFDRILNNKVIDKNFRADLKPLIRRRLGVGTIGGRKRMPKTWTLDWLEQLFEDACSVLAFAEKEDSFIFVLEKILSRNVNKLTDDQKHPDLSTRLEVANRLLENKRGTAKPSKSNNERLTDEVLWGFITKQKPGTPGYLPIAFEYYDDAQGTRKQLIEVMRDYKANFTNQPLVIDGMTTKLDGEKAQKLLPAEQTYHPSQYSQKPNQTSSIFENTKKSIEELLRVSLSEADEGDIKDHTHPDNGNTHQDMTINVHGRDHAVPWWGVWHT